MALRCPTHARMSSLETKRSSKLEPQSPLQEQTATNHNKHNNITNL
jgi:hypothetical protein